MSRMIKSVIFAVAALFATIMFGVSASATKWVELNPEELNEKSIAIVMGKYDFNNKEKTGYEGSTDYKFVVDVVYAGRIKKEIIVGINEHDIGWAEEHQKSGGKFLLFLESRDKYFEYLVPVGGPNGMIKIKDGKVIGNDANKNTFYTNIMSKEAYEPFPVINEENEWLSKVVLAVIGGLSIALITHLLIRRKPI